MDINWNIFYQDVFTIPTLDLGLKLYLNRVQHYVITIPALYLGHKLYFNRVQHFVYTVIMSANKAFVLQLRIICNNLEMGG